MSFYHGSKYLPQRFRLVLLSVLQTGGLPFSDILSEEKIERTFDEQDVSFAKEEGDVYTPAVTLWAFLSQVLHKGEQRSCLAAVSRVMVLFVALGRGACAKNSSAYCRARAKLSEQVLERLTLDVARDCEKAVPRQWLWHGRHVKLADGTTVSMPDTGKNQRVYPQHPIQKKGLGFPIARMVVLLSFATAMVSGMAMAQYTGKETGEMALMRQLLGQLNPNDILLTDRYFCSYFTIALLLQMDIDFVARIHHLRKTDLRNAQRIGKHDYLIVWMRPDLPEWMNQTTYDQIPKTITVRQIDVKVNEPGFRVQALTVVTTLTDAKKYTRDDIAELYYKRWHVELDIAAIKVTLAMDVLRCKTPEMVRKEIWTCLLAYNLIRKTMLQAAKQYKLSPRQLSFANAVQTLAASWLMLPTQDHATQLLMIEMQIESIASQLVGNRPGRIEPRAIKRHPKSHRWLTIPREESGALLRRGIDPYDKRNR